jgi:hypothetical protein
MTAGDARCFSWKDLENYFLFLVNSLLARNSMYLVIIISYIPLEASQIFLQDDHVYLNYLAIRNTADVTGGEPILMSHLTVNLPDEIN